MPVYMPPGTITNMCAFSKTDRVYTKQAGGYTVSARPPKKVNLGGKIALELIDMIALAGASEMAIADKAAKVGVVGAQLAELIMEHRRIQSPGNSVIKATEAATKAERALSMVIEGGETVITKGGREARIATKKFPRNAELVSNMPL